MLSPLTRRRPEEEKYSQPVCDRRQRRCPNLYVFHPAMFNEESGDVSGYRRVLCAAPK